MLIVNNNTYEVIYNNEKIHLTRMQYRLFYTLAKARGNVVKRTTLYNNIYPIEDQNDPKDEQMIDVLICQLRKLFKNKEIIKTTYWIGYKINEQNIEIIGEKICEHCGR